MTDAEWFERNPHRLVRRRRLPGEPEMWIISLCDTSETLVARGRLSIADASDETLHAVATELLLDGIVDAERIQQALRQLMERDPQRRPDELPEVDGDTDANPRSAAFKAIWPSVPSSAKARELETVEET